MRAPIVAAIALTLSLVSPIVTTQEQDRPNQVIALANFYDVGMKAYKERDFIAALKYLFAYRSANEKALEDNQDFLSQLDNAIAFCEKKLAEDMSTRIIGKLEKHNPEQTKVAHELTRTKAELRALEAKVILMESTMKDESVLKNYDATTKEGPVLQ